MTALLGIKVEHFSLAEVPDGKKGREDHEETPPL